MVEVNDASSTITQFKESELLSELTRSLNNETLSSYLEELEKEVFELYEHFQNEIQNEFGPTASYWNSYLDMVQRLLDYQRSLRTSDWDLHLRATEKMLPWFHTYDHFNYARHFTYYWCTQQNLGDTILGCVKLTLINILAQKGQLGASTICPQIKLLNKQLTKSRRVKAVLSVAVHQRAEYKGGS